jgi:two-component system, OmpR family, sensor histidine kinase MtrB
MAGPRSLHRVLVVAMAAMSAVGASGALALVGVTTAMHRTAIGLSDAVESVRIVEELRGNLRLHLRTSDPFHRAELEGHLRQLVDGAREHVGGAHEARLFQEVQQHLRAYLAGREDRAGSEQTLFAGLEGLVAVNVAQSRALRESATHWDLWANRAGLVAAAVLLLGVVMVIVWLRRTALEPVAILRKSAERLGRGELDMQIDLDGPAEFREIAQGFNAMAHALATKRRAQMAFLASVAHDIRNPLSALSLSLATLDQGGEAVPAAQVRRAVKLAKRQIERMQRLAGDLLDAAQFEAGAMDLRRERCDVVELARDACELFTTMSPAHQLEFRQSDSPVTVLADRIRLDQVITNVLSNAIKYSQGGTVQVAVELRGSFGAIAVSDQGEGIAPEDRLRVFDPFHRAETTARSKEGTGLGLFISSRIVRAHGGRIELVSEAGRGSTFTILLPVLEEAPRALEAESSVVSGSIQSSRLEAATTAATHAGGGPA